MKYEQLNLQSFVLRWMTFKINDTIGFYLFIFLKNDRFLHFNKLYVPKKNCFLKLKNFFEYYIIFKRKKKGTLKKSINTFAFILKKKRNSNTFVHTHAHKKKVTTRSFQALITDYNTDILTLLWISKGENYLFSFFFLLITRIKRVFVNSTSI